MTFTDRTLNSHLRSLSESGPREAPAYVEQALREAFRERRNKRRMNKRWMSMGGAALGIAAGLAAIAVLRPLPPTSAPLPEKRQARGESVIVQHDVVAVRHGEKRLRLRHRVMTRATPRDTAEFYALPDADATIPLEHATVVRVQLPLSAFREIGLAVSEQSAAGQVQADVLLGQDGLARRFDLFSSYSKKVKI